MNAKVLAILSLFIAFLALRLASHWDPTFVNMTPLASVALCFGLFARRSWWTFAAVFAGLILTDLAISKVEGLLSPAMLLRYGFFASLYLLGTAWQSRRSAPLALALAPLGSVVFYGLTNTIAWAVSTPPYAYAKSLAGWWQSQTVGLPIPGAPPSWVFLRNAVVGDLVFTFLFVALIVWLPARKVDSSLKASNCAI